MSKFSNTKFAAWLQKIVSYRRLDSGLYSEIAGHLPLEGAPRVLDVGTGTGLQLRAVHDLQPEAELYGLDLSAYTIAAAREALRDLETDLRVGSIEATDFPDDYFDVVTCNASLSYWDHPRECFNEIYRILKHGGEALLFEPHRDIDVDAALDKIRENMADKGPFRRWGAVQVNKFGLKRGGQIGMKLYTREEFTELARISHFGENNEVYETSLLNIPIFVCVHLWKPD